MIAQFLQKNENAYSCLMILPTFIGRFFRGIADGRAGDLKRMSTPKTARLVPQPDGTQPEEMTHISSFAFVSKGEQLLLVRRTRPERWAGKWCIPGAVLLYGEDPAAGARRVVREQLGANATEVKLLDVQSFGDKHWDVCFIYGAETPEIGKLGQDFDKAEYFEVARLPAELRDDHKEVLDLAKARKVV
jgi:ADP-ribose pyrophosphatase YjhB (NUDIX family)